MPRRDIRPYDRQDAGDPPKPGFIAIIASVALHLGAVERAVKSSSPFPPLPEAFGGKAAAVQLNFSLNELRRER